jgi:prefoldin subunit 5
MAPMPPSEAVAAMATDKPLEQEFDHLQKQVELLSQNLEKIQLQLAELAKTKNQ